MMLSRPPKVVSETFDCYSTMNNDESLKLSRRVMASDMIVECDGQAVDTEAALKVSSLLLRRLTGAVTRHVLTQCMCSQPGPVWLKVAGVPTKRGVQSNVATSIGQGIKRREPGNGRAHKRVSAKRLKLGDVDDMSRAADTRFGSDQTTPSLALSAAHEHLAEQGQIKSHRAQGSQVQESDPDSSHEGAYPAKDGNKEET